MFGELVRVALVSEWLYFGCVYFVRENWENMICNCSYLGEFNSSLIL